MKITIYTEQDVDYYGGETGYEYQADETISVDGESDNREWCVIEFPWQGDPRVISWHASLAAACRAAHKHGANFSDSNRGGYGWEWKPGRRVK